jgi:hypothetical protein
MAKEAKNREKISAKQNNINIKTAWRFLRLKTSNRQRLFVFVFATFYLPLKAISLANFHRSFNGLLLVGS